MPYTGSLDDLRDRPDASAALSAPTPGAGPAADGPYSGALRIPAGDDLLALSQQLRADAEQTRVRHNVRTAYCAVSIDDLVRYTAGVEQALAEPDYTDPAVQRKLDMQAARRLQLRGHISDGRRDEICRRIERKYDASQSEKGAQRNG